MNCPTNQRDIFESLMEQTRKCLAANPDGDPIACETAYLSSQTDFTFHTHPRDVPYPSDVDIETTKNMNKELLCIGLVNQNRTICFHKSDNFQQIICEF